MLRSWQRFFLMVALIFTAAAPGEAQAPSGRAGLKAGATTAPVAARATAQSQNSATLDFDKLASEAAGWLSGLLAINTTNPPGNELAAAKYISEILQKEGIAAELTIYRGGARESSALTSPW